VFDQPHPRGLEDVRRVAFGKLELPGDRPDKPAVLVDKPLPGPRVADDRAPNQLGDIQAGDI
jgi:hypothetical protein